MTRCVSIILNSMLPIRSYLGGLGNNLFQYAYLYAQAREGNIPDIYLQDPAYFEKYADELKQLLGQGIGYVPQVSIHLRRTDYVGNPFYVDLSDTDYYEKAIDLFPHDTFLVFSDDLVFAREKFKGERYKIVEGNGPTQDLNLMASCKSNIIANSTFSWWAAWLNPNPEKKVVAPKAWHPDGIERTKIPDTWIRL